MRVVDRRGRPWEITRRFVPWRRVLRLFALAVGRYRHGQWPRSGGGRSLDAEGELVVLLYGVVLGVVLLPLTLLEVVAQVTAGSVLAALRASGLVRYRVDVLGHQGEHLHSETVLLVRGGARARGLVDIIGAERRDAEHAFRPAGLGEDVAVRKHRSLWQAAGEWV